MKMKFDKFVVPVSVSAAVIAAAIAAIVVTSNRSSTARARAAEAESLEIANTKAEKAERLQKEAAEAASRRAADERKKKEAELELKKAEAEKAKADLALAEAEEKAAAAEAAAARDKAAAARDQKAAEKAKADAAKAELEKENARIEGELALSNAAVAKAEAVLATERRKTEAIIAEATVLQLQQVDFEQLQRELLEFKQELDERERALHPDVSIYDSSNVTWVAEREADVIGTDTNRLLRTRKVLTEDDPSLPKGERMLAKTDRLRYQAATNRLAASQAKLIRSLEKMRDDARRAGRVIDAEFYQKSIQSLNPDYQK